MATYRRATEDLVTLSDVQLAGVVIGVEASDVVLVWGHHGLGVTEVTAVLQYGQLFLLHHVNQKLLTPGRHTVGHLA